MYAKKVLVYSSFPPVKCGVGTYAAEHVLALKKGKQNVYLASTDSGSSAHWHVDLLSIRSVLKFSLWLIRQNFEEIHLHYSGEFYFPHVEHTSKFFKAILRLMQVLSLLLVGKLSGSKGSIIFHESYPGLTRSRLLFKLRGLAFGSFGRLEFHTPGERDAIVGAFGNSIDSKKVELVEHSRFMTPKYLGDQIQAREELNIPLNQKIFLCIGFIQAHKGFHSAVDAFISSNSDNSRLYIVGSMRTPHPDIVAYKDSLKAQVSNFRNVELREQFVSDEDFDRWIIASDVVILPYREISSSGVGARTVLCSRDLFVNNLENLKTQFGSYQKVKTFENWSNLSELISQYEVDPNLSKERSIFQSRDLSLPILFVMPWFGSKVRAGAEGFIFDLCTHLTNTGVRVEVWATASSTLEHRNNQWLKNYDDTSAAFPIRRFKSNKFAEFIFRLVHPRVSQGGRFAGLLGGIWAKTALYGKDMAVELERSSERYSTIHLCHYFAGSTHKLAGIVPQKTIIHPFIHDEPAFYNKIMSRLFAGAVGVLSNSAAERILGQHGSAGILPSSILPIGNGVSSLVNLDESGYRSRNRHIVFIGRLIHEKNLLQIVKWLDDYNKNTSHLKITLIVIGDGPLRDNTQLISNPYVKMCGRISEGEKNHYIRDSLAVVQLSKLESFSLVMIEAWAQRTPVIVHEDCLATRLQVEESGGGFAVKTSEAFSSALSLIDGDRVLCAMMGECGHAFAFANYTWEVVVDRFLQARKKLLGLDNSYKEATASEERPLFLKASQQLQTVEPLSMDGSVIRHSLGTSDIRFRSLVGEDFYVKFEEVFRDPSEAFKVFPSWPRYLEFKKEFALDDIWVDLGAGRGFFLKYLERNGFASNQLLGVEPDSASFYKLRAEPYASASMLADEYLERINDNSVKVFSMLHVAEHIPWQELCGIFKLAHAKLQAGGVLIVELPDCSTIKTSAGTFWGDPTHIRPLSEATLTFALQYCGFSIEEIGHFAPHIDDEKRKMLGEKIGFPRLIDDMYGSQDLSIIARK